MAETAPLAFVQLLRKLPVQWTLLQEAGLPQTVRERTLGHSARSTRELSNLVIRHWMDADVSASVDQANIDARSDASHPALLGAGTEQLANGSKLATVQAAAKRLPPQQDLQAFMHPDAVARLEQLEAEFQQVLPVSVAYLVLGAAVSCRGCQSAWLV